MSTPQLPLALRFPAEQRFDGFVGAEAAVAALRMLAQGQSSEPAFIPGPSGSGKTHLLLATVAEASATGLRAAYLPLGPARGRLRELLAAQEHAALVALDGLEGVAGEREDEVALFDFHNRAKAAGTALVYAARETPAALPLQLPDLRSRLGQCTQWLLAPLPEDARRALLVRRAEARGLQLDDSVLDYLFRRVGRDLGTLTALLDRIDRESLAAQRRVTVPFLRGVLE